MLSVVVVLLLTGCFSWWWSTPGQLWWLRYKIQHRVIPMMDDVPWGGDRLAMIDIMEPQWSRLIDRGFVTWYCRRFPGEWTHAQARQVHDRMERELRFPSPYEAVGGKSIAGDGSSTEIEYLLPADQHATFDAILRDVLGTTGEITEPPWRPAFWFKADDTTQP